MYLKHIVWGLCGALLLTGCGTPSTTGAIGNLQSDAPVANAPPGFIFASTTGAMPVGAETAPPFGFVGFCRRYPSDCTGSAVSPTAMQLSDARWAELREINSHVNRTVTPIEDSDLYNKPEWWTYPAAEGGDCEDYVLLKRRMLIERGWPAHTLLISVVKERNGSGHAVLLVVTDRGEFVLDNKTHRISAWRDTPYTWVKRQSRRHPYVWVRTGESRGGKSAALTLPTPNTALTPNAPLAEPTTATSGLRPSLAS
jgi:predicted transglutaminase-like cysteine proteinase